MKNWILIGLLLVLAEAKSGVTPANVPLEQVPSEQAATSGVQAEGFPVRAEEPDPQIIAEELLRLQQEMGGSIVTDQFPVTSEPPETDQSLWRDDPAEQIEALRNVSLQLEEAAHSLERLDLYQEADDLRETAARIRGVARRVRLDTAPGGVN